ncbi:MAG: Ribosomal silencing factor RsfS [Acetothermia bacterium 64_32]|nr:MAG: Ribosomal silencing factor RsfS [Acetothermia bacterium 64_32]MBC7098935.1 ribosome silencing factor [Candidatus Bipolaricaulota bacterium]HAF70908.1 ribosome silencing factor [Candidatus Acetothermia bacterium]
MSHPEWDLVERAVHLIEEKKGGRPVLLDLRETSIPTSYFLVAEGDNPVHVRAIAEELLEKLPLEPLHVEGLGQGRWVLLDYGDFVVHLFERQARDFYDLEGLWPDRVLNWEDRPLSRP